MRLMRLRHAFASLASLVVLSASALAWASSANIVAPAVAGQQALAVAVRDGAVVANVCPGPSGCVDTEGTSIDVPPEAVELLKKNPRIEDVKLAGGKRLVRVTAEATNGAAFVLMLAAPLAGKGKTPVVLWSGFTGQSKGEYGEEAVNVITEDKLADGVRIIIGQRRNDVTICGRSAVVGAREIDPTTISLKRGASVQSLSEAERASAVKLAAKIVAEPKAAPVVPLLRAQTASSAVGKAITSLTDGDLDTVWSENKTGIGQGEFAVMTSSSDVPIASLEIVIRPTTTDVPDGAAPKKFYLATTDKLFEVTLPEDAWRKAGSRFEVALPSELTTSCLSLVLDTAYTPTTAEAARVSVAEVIARTALDDRTPEALVEMLSKDQGKVASALLERAGNAGAEAAMKGYDKLDEAGRRRAEAVIEASPCTVHAPFYVRIMGDKLAASGPKKSLRDADPELVHATDRVRRCGRASAPALTELIKTASPFVKMTAAAELALLAPAEATTVLIDELAVTDDNQRREMRKALALAARNERTWSVLAAEVERNRFSTRTEVVQIDVLRALGARIQNVTGARDAFISLWAPEASFRTKYLLLGPAAELTRSGDTRASELLVEALRKDADPHVRVRAAQVSVGIAALQSALIEAADDAEVRVREAAVEALGVPDKQAPSTLPSALLVAALERRLQKDPFTFVRVQTARSLGQLPAIAASDDALAAALKDVSPDVRARAVDGLAVHRAKNHLPALRQISDAEEETPEVRARAILALGVLCDASRIDAWTTLSKLAIHGMSDGERMIGSAAIAALGDVKPKDLAKRLAPLLDPKTPRNVREAVRAALEVQSECK